ncbi:MAG: hypothetical protein ACYC27_15900 [Armatimonadota bacterium]
MNDKRIEEMLQTSWTPQEPDGMRDRILRQTREELSRKKNRRPLFGVIGWKPALVGLAILTILVTGAFDSMYQSRISAMVDGSNPGMIPSAMCKVDLMNRKYELDRLLAMTDAGYGLLDDIEGNGTL